MRRSIIPVIIVLVLIGVAVWWFVLRDPEGPSDRLELSGTVEAETTEVGSEIAGRVEQVLVQRGDVVTAGQLIAELATELGETRLSQAEAASEAARGRESQSAVAASVQDDVLAAQVRQAEQALETAQARLADLLSGSRPETIRQAEATVRQAEAAVTAARERLAKAVEGPRPQEIEQARSAVAGADQATRAAQARLDELRAGTRSQDIEQARAALETVRVRAQKALTDHERMRSLYSEGVISEDRLEQAQTAAETAQEAVRSAQAALDRALEGPREQTIRAAEAEVSRAEAARRQAAQQLALLEAGTRSEDIGAARAQVAQAQEQAEAARAHLAALRAGPTDEQIRVARRQVDEARAAVQLARSRSREVQVTRQQTEVAGSEAERAEAAADEAQVALGKHVVAAPSGGIVDSVNVREGEVASPGSSLVTLIAPEDLWVTVFVPEPELPLVEIGQRAEVAVDGWEGAFPATVIWIAQEAEFTPKYVLTEAERTRLVFEVRVRPDDADGRLKPGMPADVSIFHARREQ